METELEQALDERDEAAENAAREFPENDPQEAEHADAERYEAERYEARELRAALLEANIRVALLIEGAAREQLSEAARLAEGLCAAGAAPEQAAHEVLEGYPHLKAVRREMPQFSAQSGGSTDGFSMIRSIFARK